MGCLLDLFAYGVGAAGGAAIDARAKKKEMKRMLKGRTPEQQKVIKYFYEGGGCLKSGLQDEAYDAIVMRMANQFDFKKKALDKIGLDESQVREIEPVHFEGFYTDDGTNTIGKYGRDGKWRSSAYQITWIFFGDDQVYLYQYTFNTDEDGKKESTEEYFYRDITNFSTSSDTVEKEILDKVGCMGKESYIRKNIEIDLLSIIVPGDRMRCSMEKSGYTEKAIQGMKAKLREKKNA